MPLFNGKKNNGTCLTETNGYERGIETRAIFTWKKYQQLNEKLRQILRKKSVIDAQFLVVNKENAAKIASLKHNGRRTKRYKKKLLSETREAKAAIEVFQKKADCIRGNLEKVTTKLLKLDPSGKYQSSGQIISAKQQTEWALAKKVGVPVEYLDDLKIKQKKDGLHFYFGGQNKPDGPGHGHIYMNWDNYVLYNRPVGKKHDGDWFCKTLIIFPDISHFQQVRQHKEE